MKQHVLITGATGLIGKKLTQELLDQGFTVSHLSRKQDNAQHVKTYLWDVAKSTIDQACLEGVDAIIHLAGASVAGKRWTKKRKQKIIDSRVKSVELIYDLMKRVPHQVQTMVSASAVGYYGNRGDEWLAEESKPGDDFLSRCCILWEQAVDKGTELGLRTVKLRTGVVLSKDGGALPALAKPIKLALGTALGSGKQYMPWIHLDDVAAMYIFALTNIKLSGVFNMAAPDPVTNKALTAIVAKQLHRPYWLPNVPAFLLRFLMGEMSAIVLASDRVSAKKIEEAGFVFNYTEASKAIAAIYG